MYFIDGPASQSTGPVVIDPIPNMAEIAADAYWDLLSQDGGRALFHLLQVVDYESPIALCTRSEKHFSPTAQPLTEKVDIYRMGLVYATFLSVGGSTSFVPKDGEAPSFDPTWHQGYVQVGPCTLCPGKSRR